MEFSIILKIIGGLLSGIGSLILAWRAKILLDLIKRTLLSHELTLDTIISAVYPKIPRKYDGDIVVGVFDHLIKLESKLGFWLLVIGMVLFGLGMLITAFSYFF